MKKLILLFSLCALFLLAGTTSLHAQATLPAATPVSVTVPWSLPSNCLSTQTCQFQVYRLQGACPSTLAGSTGWTLVTTTAAQVTSYKDTTVAGGTQYCYDVEAVPTGSSTVFSGPSNAGQITTLFTPNPPIIGTITTP
jgi:hypothetical protein